MAFAIVTCALTASFVHPFAQATTEAHHVRFKGFEVTASVEPRSLGPIGVRIANLRSIGRGNRAALVVKLRFKNGADRLATTDGDFRRSAFAPEGSGDQLLIADEGCGWTLDEKGNVHAGACQEYLDIIQIEPGDHDSRQITAVEGLGGMSRLGPGSFSFRRHIKFDFAGKKYPPVVEDLLITFDIEAR